MNELNLKETYAGLLHTIIIVTSLDTSVFVVGLLMDANSFNHLPLQIIALDRLKFAKRGFIQHCSLKKPTVLLPPDEVPSFISRGAITPSGARALC
jgi:hypothetical protein